MTEPQQLLRRSRLVIGSLWAVLLSDIGTAVAGLLYLPYLRSLPPDAVVVELDLVASEALYAILGLVLAIANLLTVVLFIRWFQVAYANVSTLTGRATKHDAGWAIWAFLVPFLNLFRPQQMMREIWDETYPRYVQDAPQVESGHIPTDRVNLWWGLFLVAGFIGSGASRLSWRAVTAADESTAVIVLVISNIFDVAAAVVAISLIRGVTELQRPFVIDALEPIRP